MNKSRITAVAMLFAITTSATGCSDKKIKAQNESTVEVATEKVETSENAKDQVVFKKGKLIEVAFLSVKEGKQQQLNEEYFAKVMPVAMEYGLKPLLTVGVKNAWSEDTKPQMVGFFEWPSIDKKEAFEKDKRFLELKKVRTDALTFLKVGFYEVEQDMSVQLDASKFYEIYAMTLNEENGYLMNEYFAKAAPICTSDYNVDFALSMKPITVAGFDSTSDNVFTSQSFGIAIWPSVEANTKYFGSPEYAEIKHYKEDALQRLDAWQGALILK